MTFVSVFIMTFLFVFVLIFFVFMFVFFVLMVMVKFSLWSCSAGRPATNHPATVRIGGGTSMVLELGPTLAGRRTSFKAKSCPKKSLDCLASVGIAQPRRSIGDFSAEALVHHRVGNSFALRSVHGNCLIHGGQSGNFTIKS